MSTKILARRPWGILGGRCWETGGRGLTRLRRAFASHRHHKRFVADVGWPKCSQGHFMQQRASIGYAEVVFDDIRHGSPPPLHHNPEVFQIVSRRYPDGIQTVSRRCPDAFQTPSRLGRHLGVLCQMVFGTPPLSKPPPEPKSRRVPNGIQTVSRRYPDGIQTPSRRLLDRDTTLASRVKWYLGRPPSGMLGFRR